MGSINDVVVAARLSVQRALLGEISENLRAVALSISETSININFYFDGPIDEEDVESASCVETEVVADYDEKFRVAAHCIRIDAPKPIGDSGVWVYKRRES